jgi:hypothetical protein
MVVLVVLAGTSIVLTLVGICVRTRMRASAPAAAPARARAAEPAYGPPGAAAAPLPGGGLWAGVAGVVGVVGGWGGRGGGSEGRSDEDPGEEEDAPPGLPRMVVSSFPAFVVPPPPPLAAPEPSASACRGPAGARQAPPGRLQRPAGAGAKWQPQRGRVPAAMAAAVAGATGGPRRGQGGWAPRGGRQRHAGDLQLVEAAAWGEPAAAAAAPAGPYSYSSSGGRARSA